MATPIGGGAYQEVSQKELLDGVEDNPVLIMRPEKLRNKYYGLRHGEDYFGVCYHINLHYVNSFH